jgi:CHAD domain-containing protein
VSALATAAIAEVRAQFIQHERRAVTGEPEAVHQARVALRKLRLYVRLFRSRVGRARAEQLQRDLRWLFSGLGELRDLQVFQCDVLPAAKTPARSAHALATRIAQQAEQATRELGEIAASERHRRLLEQLAELERDLRARDDDKAAHEWLIHRLARMHKRLRKEAREALHETSARHALRKRLKRTRYAAQLADAWQPEHPKRARELRRRTSALQDALGALIDLRVARRRIAAAQPARALRQSLYAELRKREQAREAELEPALEAFASARSPWK